MQISIYLSSMTGQQQFNLLWLAMAITAPEYTQERYYYDAKSNLFFSARPTLQPPVRLDLFDTKSKFLPSSIESDISVRLLWLNDESSEIIEIPRLNIADKIAIQLLFLSNFGGVMHLQELVSAVEDQRDDYKMVLDTILIENSNTAPIAPYWDEFKLKTVFEYIMRFASLIGLDLSIC